MLACRFNRRFGQINARIIRASLSEHDAVRAVAATDLKDAATAHLCERHELRDVPFGLVAKAAILREEIARVRVVLDELCAARFGVPERSDLLDCLRLAH